MQRPKVPLSAIVNFGVGPTRAIPELQAVTLTDGLRTRERESQQSAEDLPPGIRSQLTPGSHHGGAQQHEPTPAAQRAAEDDFFGGEQALIEATHRVECLACAE